MLTKIRPVSPGRIRDARERVARITTVGALAELEADYMALLERRHRRIPTGRIHQIHCPRCRVFKRSLSDICTRCGWSPFNGWGS